MWVFLSIVAVGFAVLIWFALRRGKVNTQAVLAAERAIDETSKPATPDSEVEDSAEADELSRPDPGERDTSWLT